MKTEIARPLYSDYHTRKLTWRHLLALNELYKRGSTRSQIFDNAYLEHRRRTERDIDYKLGNKNIIEAKASYRAFYEREHKEDFERYEKFLNEAGLKGDGKRRYTEDDLTTMMFIYNNRDELKGKLTTSRQFSGLFFHSSKYMESHPGLLAAVCHLLGIVQFPDKEPTSNQWRLVVDCLNPVAVVLCENLDYLKVPWKAREHSIELWYVGGNNIGIIDYIANDKLRLPLYYSCDWDNAGLTIYSRIKSKLKEKDKEVALLLPHDTSCAQTVDSPHHKSKWEGQGTLSNLVESDFEEDHKQLIRHLVRNNLWIEEETQDLIEVLRKALVIID